MARLLYQKISSTRLWEQMNCISPRHSTQTTVDKDMFGLRDYASLFVEPVRSSLISDLAVVVRLLRL